MNKFQHYFFNEPKTLLIHKWVHYLEIYEKHFNKFLNKSPNILEIGVYEGGSLEMWNYYFDKNCQIYGIDIDPSAKEKVKKLNVENIQVDIGDQENRNFWKDYLKDKPKFDIVIEDGGHTIQQQIVTFEEVYEHVSENGVYLCEDLHTSYWKSYGGELKNPNTFIEYSKNFIDMLNAYHIPNCGNEKFKRFRDVTKSISYYDSVIVLEKGSNPPPKDQMMK